MLKLTVYVFKYEGLKTAPGSSVLSQNGWKVILLKKAPYISKILFTIVTFFTYIFIGLLTVPAYIGCNFFVGDKIYLIGLICLTNFNVINLGKSVHDATVLRCFLYQYKMCESQLF